MLVLASASARRIMLLRAWGFRPEVIQVIVSELLDRDISPREGVILLAERKALAGLAQWRKLGGKPEDLVLGADTMVVLGRESLGKPGTPAEAREMLQSLSGRQHSVLTGVAIIRLTGEKELAVVETEVNFRKLSADQIRTYVATGESMDKAGAYAIQGGAQDFVESYSGSLTNVIGLPMEYVSEKLKTWGRCQPGELFPRERN
ncbi:MAG: Maf family protein [Desulfitobacteriaceae bacterium]|nr:Maf family protein [Desulfitobacteriaceae bacterium]MDD4345731.1 Maf family protein [Desulfitobacteriaceae bacterium]